MFDWFAFVCTGSSSSSLVAFVTSSTPAGEEVTRATPHGESATLALAYATERFVASLMRAMQGGQHVVECAFVENNLTESAFFSSPVKIGFEMRCYNKNFK